MGEAFKPYTVGQEPRKRVDGSLGENREELKIPGLNQLRSEIFYAALLVLLRFNKAKFNTKIDDLIRTVSDEAQRGHNLLR